jgi:hypothetical protein
LWTSETLESFSQDVGAWESVIQVQAKVQHYVPRFLLKQFGIGKKDQLHVFDKQTVRVFMTNARNVAAEKGFYDFSMPQGTFSIEPWLGQLESRAKKILKAILERDSLANLAEDDRATLCGFLAVQLTRTRHFRLQVSGLPDLLMQHFRKHGDKLAPELEQSMRPPDENQTAIEAVKIICEAPAQFGPVFMNKTWMLFAGLRNHPFIIGDNPLALQNQIDQWPRGNLGLAVEGIEVYLPLTPSRTLGFVCPTILQRLSAAAQRDVLQAFEEGNPVELSQPNVVNLNSLQVRSAERYLFSSTGDFSLAHEMLRGQPHLRHGPRFEAS